jgi:hypothetical protein
LILFEAVGGLYQAGHGSTRRVGTGALLAVGPGVWLTVECDDEAVCRTVLRFRTGRSRVVPAAIGPQARRGATSSNSRSGPPDRLLIDP